MAASSLLQADKMHPTTEGRRNLALNLHAELGLSNVRASMRSCDETPALHIAGLTPLGRYMVFYGRCTAVYGLSEAHAVPVDGCGSRDLSLDPQGHVAGDASASGEAVVELPIGGACTAAGLAWLALDVHTCASSRVGSANRLDDAVDTPASLLPLLQPPTSTASVRLPPPALRPQPASQRSSSRAPMAAPPHSHSPSPLPALESSRLPPPSPRPSPAALRIPRASDARAGGRADGPSEHGASIASQPFIVQLERLLLIGPAAVALLGTFGAVVACLLVLRRRTPRKVAHANGQCRQAETLTAARSARPSQPRSLVTSNVAGRPPYQIVAPDGEASSATMREAKVVREAKLERTSLLDVELEGAPSARRKTKSMKSTRGR